MLEELVAGLYDSWEMEMKEKEVSDDFWNVKPELLAGGGVLGANQHADILQL